MTQHEIMRELAEVIADAKAGVLATVDEHGNPHVRWMTPAILKDRQSALFAVTSPRLTKLQQLKANPRAEWMIQSLSLGTVITVRGAVNLLDNPSLKSEVLEELGPRLQTYWHVSPDAPELVVLETVIDEIDQFHPLRNHHVTVKFN